MQISPIGRTWRAQDRNDCDPYEYQIHDGPDMQDIELTCKPENQQRGGVGDQHAIHIGITECAMDGAALVAKQLGQPERDSRKGQYRVHRSRQGQSDHHEFPPDLATSSAITEIALGSLTMPM